MNVEYATSTPLVFSLTGGEGHGTSTFHKYIAQKSCEKNEEKCEKVLSLIRWKISFLILRSVMISVRGSHSVNNVVNDNVVLDDIFLTGQTVGLF